MTALRADMHGRTSRGHRVYDAPVMHRARPTKDNRYYYGFRHPGIRMKNARGGVFSVGADRKQCDCASRARVMALVACRICREDLGKPDAPVMHGRFAGSGLCFARLGGPTRNPLSGRVEPHLAQRSVMPLDRPSNQNALREPLAARSSKLAPSTLQLNSRVV